MAGFGAIIGRLGSVCDGFGVFDRRSPLSTSGVVLAMPDGAVPTQIVVNIVGQKFPARVEVNAAIDRLWTDVPSLIARVVAMQASGDLFWRPAVAQPRGHVVAQDWVLLQLQPLGSVSAPLCTVVGLNGPIGFLSLVAPDFAADRRW